MNLKKISVIAATAGALSAVALPALAETTFYGSARIGTFYDTNKSGDVLGTNAGHGKSQTDFDIRNFATSRLGLDTKVENLSGKVEIGLGAGTNPADLNNSGTIFQLNQAGDAGGTSGNAIVYIRHIYGTYKFSPGTLLVGQTWNPYFFGSEQVANDDNGNGNDGTGATYDGRGAQVKFTLNNGLYAAFIRPSVVSGSNTSKSVYLPKISLGYEGKVNGAAFGLGVVGQTYKNTGSTVAANTTTQSINSIMGYAHAKGTFGPFVAYTNLAAGQNEGDMGVPEGKNTAIPSNAAGNTSDTANYQKAGINGAAVGPNYVKNALTYSAMIGVGYTLSDMLKLQSGIGYVNTQRQSTPAFPTVRHDDKVEAWVNAPITLAKGVMIVPEFTYRDMLFASNGDREQKDFIYGAKWQFDF